MNDTNFKQSLREKAEKYEMDAPQGLWEDIERKVKGRIFIRRFALVSAAAATVALIVGLGIGLTRETPVTEPLIAEVPVAETTETTETTESPTPDNSELLAESLSEPAILSQPAHRAIHNAAIPEQTAAAEPAEEADNQSENVPTYNENGSETDEVNENAARPSVVPERSQLTDTEYYRDAFREDDQRRRHRSEGLTVKLLTANSASVSLGMGKMMDADFAAPANSLQPAGGISSDTSDSGANVEDNPVYSADRIGDILIANLNEPTASESKHHQPLTFGVRVAYPLTDRLAVESGLNYSLLRSDFNYGGSKAYEEKKQALHYLGIPLSLNYTLLRLRRLEFIVSAGAMAEKCVYGKATTDFMIGCIKKSESSTLSVGGLQWSSVVSASLQYNFARDFGLFLEPGLWYRFENSRNGEVRSSYTEEPLNFSLAFGARFAL